MFLWKCSICKNLITICRNFTAELNKNVICWCICPSHNNNPSCWRLIGQGNLDNRSMVCNICQISVACFFCLCILPSRHFQRYPCEFSSPVPPPKKLQKQVPFAFWKLQDHTKEVLFNDVLNSHGCSDHQFFWLRKKLFSKNKNIVFLRMSLSFYTKTPLPTIYSHYNCQHSYGKLFVGLFLNDGFWWLYKHWYWFSRILSRI